MNIRIFDVGRGSSVLIELPPNSHSPRPVGIVDCFSGAHNKGPLIRHLDQLDSESGGKLAIEFFVLTHMHADHFLGAAAILKKYKRRIRKYFDPGIDPRRIMVADFSSRGQYDSRARKEIDEIVRFKSKNHTRVRPLASPDAELYLDTENDVIIRSLAPEGAMLTKVERALENFVETLKAANENDVVPPITGFYDLNKTSSAIEIWYKGRKIVLGGDVLRGTWESVFSELAPIGADVFLLSHHGAANAFPKSHWSKLHKDDGHVIVSGKGRGQPSPSVLSFIQTRTKTKIWATNLPDTYRVVDHVPRYVLGVHYGVKLDVSVKAGDVLCTIGSDLKVTGPSFNNAAP